MTHSFFPIQRNRYFYGKLLTVRDFESEQQYGGVKRRLVNRVVHGPGVVCGLGVTASDDSTLIIESGMALDYLGREIFLEEPLIRKLEMLEGQEKLKGRDDIYLCLAYHEVDIEPVNAVGAESGGRQCNVTQEGFRLFLSEETPAFHALLEAQGRENVNILYASDTLQLVLSLPGAVCAGQEFQARVLVVKNDKTLPVRFTLEGASGFVETETGKVLLEYHESPEETRNVLETEFTLKAQNLTDVAVQLFPEGMELNLELGSHKYKNFIGVSADVFICGDQRRLRDHLYKTDTLAKHLRGKEIPLYLAKLDLLGASERTFVGTVTNLPFGQIFRRPDAGRAGGLERLSVTTSVKPLEFWQKPDVQASVGQAGDIHLNFGIPTPEIYDYATSHGVVEIPIPGGVKVNARYFSDEVAHGLGPGNVDVRLSLEYENGNSGPGQLFGNSEVFKHKSFKDNLPWVEAAAVVYPARGTMRIGVWLHDNVEGNLVRIHYYAEKPERDTKRLLETRQVSVSVIPEILRVGKREQARFKATVLGSEDKNVAWRVRDDLGGEIDANGIYQAPETPGTYEIVATASADDTVTASAFVIVE
jgi:hypothetical protein